MTEKHRQRLKEEVLNAMITGFNRVLRRCSSQVNKVKKDSYSDKKQKLRAVINTLENELNEMKNDMKMLGG